MFQTQRSVDSSYTAKQSHVEVFTLYASSLYKLKKLFSYHYIEVQLWLFSVDMIETCMTKTTYFTSQYTHLSLNGFYDSRHLSV